MIMPRWVDVVAQPIAIKDMLDYLVAALDLPDGEHRIFEIGGADRVSYGDIMREYARQRGLKRLMIPVPVLTPKLSSLWLGLVTPLYARVGRILVDSMRHETVVRDRAALEVFPIRPMGIREAIAAALAQRGPRVCANPLVRLAQHREPEARLGRRPFRQSHRGHAHRHRGRITGGCVRAD